MARVGSFSPSTFIVGAPLQVIHPSDNKVPIFDPEIEALKGLSDKDRLDLQAQVDELSATLTLAREQS